MSVENIHPGVPFESNRNLAIGWARARLDTTTKPAVDSLSLRRRSGVREKGFQKSATIRWNEPLSPTLSPLVPRRERGHFSNGGCIKMRPVGAFWHSLNDSA